MNRTFTFLLPAVLTASAVSADQVRFTSGPEAARAAGGVRITFAVSAPTDVEVAVLDAQGKVVRHLAAGLLGPNAPAPFIKGSLEQSLAWDLKDDLGRPAAGGPFKVRVGLGMKAEFERVIGWSGQYTDPPRGLACGPDGTLYLVHGGGLYAHRQTTIIAAYDRKGRYLREVFPGPAGLPGEKRRGWPRIRPESGEEVPVVFHVLTRSTYPGAHFGNRVFPALTRDGRLVILSGAEKGSTIKGPDIRGGRRLLILGADGSVPEDFLGPVVADEKMGGFGHVALSPDDRYAYVAGLFEEEKKGRGLAHVVWRVPLDGSGPARVFIGKLYQPGAGGKMLDDPQGLAVDAQGDVYVADYGNNRVAVFGPDGSFLAEIPVEYPDQVRVSRRTGAIYVLTIEKRTKPVTDGHWYAPGHNWKGRRIVKFSPLPGPREASSLDVPRFGRYGGGAFLALDDSSSPPVLWYAGAGYQRRDIYRIVDRGKGLENTGDPVHAGLKKNTALPFIGDVAVVGRKLITRHPAFGFHTNTSLVFDALTGEPLGTYVPKTPQGNNENMWNLLYGEMVAGRDGLLYVHRSSKGQLRRYDAEGRPVPFAAVGSHVLEGFFHGHTRPAGLFVTASGHIFLPAAPGNRKLEDVALKHVGPDGRVMNDSLVRVQNARIGGVALDRAGNIYLGLQIAPRGKRIPDWFAGKLPPDSSRHHPSLAYKQYGSVVKFPPTGGGVLVDPQGKYVAHVYYRPRRVRLEGALWVRRGGYLPNHGKEVGCLCETTRFDIDEFGRVYLPDVFRLSVQVLDGAGNEVARFGSYGNMDSRGPGSPVPVPAIPFGWPLSVEYAGGRIFVADLVNRRIVAVRLASSLEKVVAVD